MNVKSIIDKIHYDATNPVLFIINGKTYNFFEVVSNQELLNTPVNNIVLEARLSKMTEEDIVKVLTKDDLDEDLFDVVLPTNSHFYLVVIKIT